MPNTLYLISHWAQVSDFHVGVQKKSAKILTVKGTNKYLKGMAPTECPISARLLAFLQSLTSWAPVHAMGEYSSKCGGVVSKSDLLLLQGNPDINKSR